MKKRFSPALVAALCVLFVPGSARAGITFYNDLGTFNLAVAALLFEGTEDFESSTLEPNMITSFLDPLAPGVPNGPFPTGTNPATGLTVQSNTLGGMPIDPSPGGSLATASAGYSGTPTDQVSNSAVGASFDMIFGLADTAAVSFIPLVFDQDESGDAGTATIRVFNSSNVLIGTVVDIPVAGFMNPTTFTGVVAMPGDAIGRINVFATSTDDVFSGADDIDVYTRQSAVVPEPATLTLLLGGLGVLGVAVRRRK